MSSHEKDSPIEKTAPAEKWEEAAVETEVDPTAEKRLMRKLDIRIVPFFFLLYTLSFLDRINIGNGIIQGMDEDLDLRVNHRFNNALLFFYITYITLEIPSNMLLKKSKPNWYLAGLMFCWGVTNMCMGFVQNYEGLLGLRLVLGIFEAGVLPGIIFIVPMYYRRDEVQSRMSIILMSGVIAGAFGGLLAYGIADLSGERGYKGWRWIFIIEGAFTACIALLAPFILVGYPEKTKFLSPEEKTLLARRRALDQEEYPMDTLNAYSAKLILRDPKVWLAGLAFFGLGNSGLTTVQFLPSILREFGWQGKEAQIRTVPIYMVSLVLTMVVSVLSDRYKHRYGFIMLGLVISTVGYGILLNQEALNLSKNGKYGAAFLIPTGGFASIFLILGWPSYNMSGRWKRSIGAGIQVTLGNLNGPVTSYMFLEEEKPYYRTGFGVGLGLAWFGGLCATAMAVLMWWENRKRERGERDYRLERKEEEVRNLGDDHPGFRFTL